MNNVFNIKRFARLCRHNFLLNKKVYLLMVLGMFTSIFLFTIIALSRINKWDGGNWDGLLAISAAITGLIYIGSAFLDFRKKEHLQSYLLLPASVTEKFVFEFSIRFIVFLLVFPVLFFFATGLGIDVVQIITPKNITVMSIKTMTFFDHSDQDARDVLKLLIFAYLFVFSIAFVGAASFKKQPLLKTIILVAIFIGACSVYMSILISKFEVEYPWIRLAITKIGNVLRRSPDEFLLPLFVWVFLVLFVLALYTSYLKVKEKEI